ncbi:MAG: LuxR C-terminal-related transcriptional regulator [Clostridiales Family XIII bacterium]|jgi:DNA-binding CsgD family transcriptional regulator|nr:LuxR C-terminal-related transcriptional regulator [Clostridiales Family XIII bacterium]
MLEQKDWEQLNKIVNTIFSTQDITLMRKKVLHELSVLIPSDLSNFKLAKMGRNRTPRLVDAIVQSNYSKQFETEFISNYENFYHEVDYARWIFTSPSSHVYRESDLISETARQNSAYYKEYLEPSGLTIIAGISIINEGQLVGSLALYRKKNTPDFTDKEQYILTQLTPHLQTRLTEYKTETENVMTNTSYYLREHYGLTAREIEIIGRIYMGESNEQICKILFISENTVKKHIYHIFEKMGAKSRASLMHILIKEDLLGGFDLED